MFFDESIHCFDFVLEMVDVFLILLNLLTKPGDLLL